MYIYIYIWTYIYRSIPAGVVIVQELCESRGGRPAELSVLTSLLFGFRGRKELLNRASALVTTCP